MQEEIPDLPSAPQRARRLGLFCALATPFAADGSIDLKRLTDHAARLVSEGCDGVAVFGTTGEGASIGLPERRAVLDALGRAGFDPRRLVCGVSASAAEDAADQARLGLDAGCRGLLVPPPFYFKDVTDDGLFAWFADVFERLGAAARDVILYHIPPVTEVPLSVDLVGRLKTAFPGIVAGVKDSSGDWPYAEALLRTHGDLMILAGDERRLADAVRLGAEGTISGLANVAPKLLRPLVDEGRPDRRVVDLVDEILRRPVTPAVKALVAHTTGDAAWARVRPPLVPLAPDQANAFIAACDAILRRGAK